MQAVVGRRAGVFAACRVTGGGELRDGRCVGCECREQLVQTDGDGYKACMAGSLACGMTDIACARLHPGAANIANAKFPAR